MISLIKVYILLLIFLKVLADPISNDCRDVKDNPSVKMDKIINPGNSSLYSVIKFNCSAWYPIEWIFIKFPIDYEWNVTYSRMTGDAFDSDPISSFESVLIFYSIFEDELAEIGPICKDVDSSCRFLKVFNRTNGGKTGNSTPIAHKDDPAHCPLDFWFDTETNSFHCKSNDNLSKLKLESKPCSNPTECGVLSETDQICNSNSLKLEPSIIKPCKENSSTCQILNWSDKSQHFLPQIISCSDQNGQSTWTFKPLNFANDTEEFSKAEKPLGSQKELLSIEIGILNRQTIREGESVDLLCDASYFHFAKGLHLTVRDLLGVFPEVDLLSSENGSQFGENVRFQEVEEMWMSKSSKGFAGRKIPTRRNLIVQGISLGAGDWKLTCYAPVWNSTGWETKSVFLFVVASILPRFVTGNSTRVVPFQPNKNISCVTMGSPAPILSWVYDKEKLEGEELLVVDGQHETSSWSVITIPKDFSGSKMEFRCHAKNDAGFVEKVFLLDKKEDESQSFSTRIASTIIIFGVLMNVLIIYGCWKFIAHEDEDNTQRFL